MAEVKISVVTVNLNNAEGLNKTLKSLVGQSVVPEIIVIDGKSGDRSVEVINEYVSRLTFWISEKDSGIYEAMNKGIAQAKGDFLLFLNSGDSLYEPDTIKNVLAELKSNDEIVYGNLKFDNGTEVTEGYMPDKITLDHMMRDTLWHPASFIRRKLFDDFGNYDTSYRIAGDYDFFVRTIIANKVRARHIHQFIAVFDLRGLSSDVANHARINAEKEMARSKHLTGAETDRWKRSQKNSLFNIFKKWFR